MKLLAGKIIEATYCASRKLRPASKSIAEAVLSAPVTQYAADLIRVVSIGRSNAFFKLEKGSGSEEGGDVVAYVPGLDERLLVCSCADGLESFNLRIPRKGDMTNE